jgi:chromate reductase
MAGGSHGQAAHPLCTIDQEKRVMSMTRKIAVFVGSLRKGSFNRMTAKVLIALAPAELQFEIVEIGDLPLYNQDHDDAPPPPYLAFREKIKAADAVLFVTSEYNRSVPGVLKNAIDVGSRPLRT